MQSKTHLILFGVAVLFLLSSCKNTKQRSCEIDVLVTSVPEDGKLSEDLLSTLSPFVDKEGAILLPQGNLFTPISKVTYVKQKTWLEKLRGNMTKNTTLLILSEKIKKHLSSIDLSPLKGDYKVDDAFIEQNRKEYDLVMYLNNGGKSNTQLKFETAEDFHTYLMDSISSKKVASKILLVYGRTESTSEETTDPVNQFAKQIHDKLMAIAGRKTGEEKIYEERIQLATSFIAEYVDASTDIKQHAGEGGFFMKAYEGEEAARYVRSLAEQDLIMSDLVIVEMNQSPTGKIGLLKIKEIQAKIP